MNMDSDKKGIVGKKIRIGSNMTEVVVDDGFRVLYSYETPVAGYRVGSGWFKTDRWYSVTTTRHVNKYLDGVDARTVEQDEIIRLVDSHWAYVPE